MRRNLVLGVAAVVVVAAVGIASLWWLIHDVRARSPQPPIDDVRVVQAGFAIDAVLVGTDGRHLTVATHTQSCGTPRLEADETGSTVVVAIPLLSSADPRSVCDGTPAPSEYSTVLRQPVGARTITDNFGGTVPRVDEAHLLGARYLPSGYRLQSEHLLVDASVQRTYTGPGSAQDIVVDQGPGAFEDPGSPPSGRVPVSGSTADVYEEQGAVEVRWASGGLHRSVTVHGAASVAEPVALRVARGLSR